MKKSASLLGMCMFFSACLFIFTGVQARAEGSSGYAGLNACGKCHPVEFESYSSSIHAKKAISGSPANAEACESCHGPGAEHVAKGGLGDIFAFNKKTAPKAKEAKCLSCHEETGVIAFWSQGKHAAEGVSCDNCHSIHHGGYKFLKGVASKGDVYEVCYRCHRDIRNMVDKQSHHPVEEGKVSCADCHNPHGTFNEKMLTADTVNDLCYKCHPDKRGPFMNEHPPVEENCLNCHTPHGSNHNKLLVEHGVVLCQRCHDTSRHPGTPYTQWSTFNPPAGLKNVYVSPRIVARMCLNCHTNIHGSNYPGTYGETFIR